ncbi:hypothetical protein PybrP1_003916 [[Pythium] brassicae (nom. inval.)]|nr:hypothetical protein PybrP1_003916 [[Pythium] brassicae (nom. inval.)]
MTRDEKQVSLTTALSVLSVADTAERKRGKSVRQRFAYYLPLLGEVCRDSFCAVYVISTPTLTLYRNRIASGDLMVARHGLKKNKNAAKLDADWMVSWFKELAERQGEFVPLRIRRQTTTNGEVVRYVFMLDHLLLPSYNTWHDISLEMQDNAERLADAVISLEHDDSAFCNYKDVVSALNNNVKGLQKYQLISARHTDPCVLERHRTPGSPPDVFDLRKTVDGELVTG